MQIEYDKWDEIIWHTVMIWDVLDWIEKNKNLQIDPDKLVLDNFWKEKRKPIDDQDDETIDFTYFSNRCHKLKHKS